MQGITSFLSVLILLGTLQGLITVFVLYRLKVNKNVNRRLAWIVLLISLACLNLYLLEVVTVSAIWLDILFAVVPLVVIMPVGPLVYFYIKALLFPDHSITRKDRRHFYTVILDLLPHIVFAILIIGGFLGLVQSTMLDSTVAWVEVYNTYVDIPRWISLSVYLYMSYQLWQQQLKAQKETPQALWAKRFLIGLTLFSVIWLFHLVPYIIPSISNYLLTAVGWYPIYIPLVILVYWLGVNGYIIGYKALSKPSKNVLKEVDIEETLKRLEDLMEKEQWYLNPSLKLQDVVQHTGISQKNISAVLNQHLGKSLNEYINTYRIEAFKKRILDPKNTQLTITGIAFECGFNSQATFQRVFKKLTGQSPKEFQSSHSKSL